MSSTITIDTSHELYGKDFYQEAYAADALEKTDTDEQIRKVASDLEENYAENPKELGKGNNGTVYKAKHRITGEELAYKSYHGTANNPDHLEHVISEGNLYIGERTGLGNYQTKAKARKASKKELLYLAFNGNIVMPHPWKKILFAIMTNGAKAPDTLIKEARLNFSSDIINGGNLWDYAQLDKFKAPIIPIKDIAQIAYNTLSAIDAMHSCDLIHGDVSPENIFIELDNEVNIIRSPIGDLGLALKVTDSNNKTVNKTDLGKEEISLFGNPKTVDYSQLYNQTLSQKSDLYSWAHTIMELLRVGRSFEFTNARGIVNHYKTCRRHDIQKFKNNEPTLESWDSIFIDNLKKFITENKNNYSESEIKFLEGLSNIFENCFKCDYSKRDDSQKVLFELEKSMKANGFGDLIKPRPKLNDTIIKNIEKYVQNIESHRSLLPSVLEEEALKNKDLLLSKIQEFSGKAEELMHWLDHRLGQHKAIASYNTLQALKHNLIISEFNKKNPTESIEQSIEIATYKAQQKSKEILERLENSYQLTGTDSDFSTYSNKLNTLNNYRLCKELEIKLQNKEKIESIKKVIPEIITNNSSNVYELELGKLGWDSSSVEFIENGTGNLKAKEITEATQKNLAILKTLDLLSQLANRDIPEKDIAKLKAAVSIEKIKSNPYTALNAANLFNDRTLKVSILARYKNALAKLIKLIPHNENLTVIELLESSILVVFPEANSLEDLGFNVERFSVIQNFLGKKENRNKSAVELAHSLNNITGLEHNLKILENTLETYNSSIVNQITSIMSKFHKLLGAEASKDRMHQSILKLYKPEIYKSTDVPKETETIEADLKEIGFDTKLFSGEFQLKQAQVNLDILKRSYLNELYEKYLSYNTSSQELGDSIDIRCMDALKLSKYINNLTEIYRRSSRKGRE